MHLLFIDESGTPSKRGDTRPPYFAIGGLIVPEDKWHKLRDALLGLKARRGIRGELKWRYFAPGNTDLKNPLRHLEQAARDEIRLEIYNAILREPSVRSLAAVCSPRAAYEISSILNQDDVYQLTYKTMLERFQYYLQDLSTSARRELGIVVADHRGSQDDKRLRAHHQKLLHSGAEFNTRYRNLVEGLFLEPSNLSVGIQLADMIVGAVWRAYEKQDKRWFDLIRPTFRRSPKGEIEGYGLVKVPKAGWI